MKKELTVSEKVAKFEKNAEKLLSNDSDHIVCPFAPFPDYVDQNPPSVLEKLKQAPTALEVKNGLKKDSFDSSSSVDDLSQVQDSPIVFEDIPSLHEREKLEQLKKDVKSITNNENE